MLVDEHPKFVGIELLARYTIHDKSLSSDPHGSWGITVRPGRFYISEILLALEYLQHGSKLTQGALILWSPSPSSWIAWLHIYRRTVCPKGTHGVLLRIVGTSHSGALRL